MNFKPDEVEAARRTVYSVMPPTPQYAWPMLRERLGMKVWGKHENHTPAGVLKVRAGVTYFAGLAAAGAKGGVVTATRGKPWAVGRLCGAQVRPGRHDRGATRQLGGKERGHADAGRNADRAWRRLPGGPRTRCETGGRPALAHGSLFPSRPDQGRDELLGGILRKFSTRRGAR